jgi:hypothetical protein
MLLKCKCGYQWDYQGKARHHAFCPKCKSKILINSYQPDNPSLEKLAMVVSIEVSMPKTKNDAIVEAQKYAQEAFGDSSLAYLSIVLIRNLRIRHSNYRKLLMEIYHLAKAQDATSDEIREAFRIIKERVDIRINDLMRSTWV